MSSIAAKETFEKVQSIALRWVRARPYAMYSSVNGVTFDERNGLIRFTEHVSPSGYNPVHAIPTKYLDDDSTLEADSRAEYQRDQDERTAKHNRVQELKASAPVQELMRLGYTVEPYRGGFIL